MGGEENGEERIVGALPVVYEAVCIDSGDSKGGVTAEGRRKNQGESDMRLWLD